VLANAKGDFEGIVEQDLCRKVPMIDFESRFGTEIELVGVVNCFSEGLRWSECDGGYDAIDMDQ
jgi:hypothetical protein